MKNVTKLKYAWKYRRYLWKHRGLIRRRKEIAAALAASGVIIAAAVWIHHSRSEGLRAGGE